MENSGSCVFVELSTECLQYCDLSSRIAEIEGLMGFIAINFVLLRIEYASEIVEIGPPSTVLLRVLLLLQIFSDQQPQPSSDQILLLREAERRRISVRQISTVDSIEHLLSAKSKMQDLRATNAPIWRQIHSQI